MALHKVKASPQTTQLVTGGTSAGAWVSPMGGAPGSAPCVSRRPRQPRGLSGARKEDVGEGGSLEPRQQASERGSQSRPAGAASAAGLRPGAEPRRGAWPRAGGRGAFSSPGRRAVVSPRPWHPCPSVPPLVSLLPSDPSRPGPSKCDTPRTGPGLPPAPQLRGRQKHCILNSFKKSYCFKKCTMRAKHRQDLVLNSCSRCQWSKPCN